MILDFTLNQYTSLLLTLREESYDILPMSNIYTLKNREQKIAALRHDVDRSPHNASKLAKIEYNLGISSTYYLRYPKTFRDDLVADLIRYGHEIGYHYEVLSKTNGDKGRSRELFIDELSSMRIQTQILTATMHGSPLSPFDNRDVVTDELIHRTDLLGDPSQCLPDQMVYFTDTGRRWDGKSNIRDQIGEFSKMQGCRRTSDLIEYIQSVKPGQICISTHPERWSGTRREYTRSLLRDICFNSGKKIIRVLRHF